MPNFICRKLMGYDTLSADDIAALEAACSVTIKAEADKTLVREDESPSDLLAILEGWACRYKILPDGGRQILGFLMPGDICDMSASVIVAMDHDVGTLTPVTLAKLSRRMTEALLHERPRLTRAFLWAQMVDEGILRAWLASLGRRDAYDRVGHLLCELWARAKNVGLVTDHQIDLPVTQTELSDALGLTPVHTNRVLRRLREEGLIVTGRGRLTIPDAVKLAKAVGFSANYLQGRNGRQLHQ